MRQWRMAALGLVLVVAALLRAPALGSVPPGLWFDEALNGQDAVAVWQPGGHFRIVYPDVFPREPMYETLLALVIRAGGPNIVVMRSLSAAIGILTVLLLYLTLRAQTGETAALSAAAVLATMRWHVIFSRLIFRTLVLPLWICALVWSALAWRRRPTAWRAAIFGILLGGGFYTYLAWYFMLPLAGILALWAAVGEWKSKAGRARLALAACFAIAVAAPILIHYATHRDDLFNRPKAVSPFSGGVADGVAEIGQNLSEALTMFFWRGDHVPLQNIPNKAALDGVQMLFFAWGAILCLAAIRRNIIAPILLLWLMCGIAPTIFTYTDSPNFLRSLVASPAVAALTGIGLADAAGRIARGRKTARAALIALVILASAVLTARDVYLAWPRRMDVWERFHGRAVQIAKFANEASADAAVFIPEPFMSAEERPFHFVTLTAARPENIYPYFDRIPLGPWPPVPAAAGRPEPARRILVIPANTELFKAIAPWTDGPPVKTFTTPTGSTWALAVNIPEEKTRQR